VIAVLENLKTGCVICIMRQIAPVYPIRSQNSKFWWNPEAEHDREMYNPNKQNLYQHARAHTHTHARAHAHTHTHTHTPAC
jgi:hypothetical protein